MHRFNSLHTSNLFVVKFIFKQFALLIIISLCVILSACGKRPVNIDNPPNVDSSMYSQTYPDISTDTRY